VPETYEEQRMIECSPNHPTFLVRLVVWERSSQQFCSCGSHLLDAPCCCKPLLFIKDVKEQLVHLPKNLSRELAEHDGRNANFCAALKKVCAEVLARDDVERRMPTDFFKFDPLGKKTFGTEAEFEVALRKKGRLGGLL